MALKRKPKGLISTVSGCVTLLLCAAGGEHIGLILVDLLPH